MTERVLVAMSGGVDSSVALLKILEAGYDAVGVTMKLWEYRDVGGNLLRESNCCPIEAINDAREVCVQLGVPHYTLDFQEEFREQVIDNFVSEYRQGNTPNPCVRCNSLIKWNALLEQADRLGANKIATGHYARIEPVADGSLVLKKGHDQNKDQSYVLWGIPRASLAHTLLPLGNFTKAEVRALAAKHELATAGVEESQDICFVPDNDYRRFLEEMIPEQMAAGVGEIVDEAGEVLGYHQGHAAYTVGQRRGLGIAAPEPLYVTSIDPRSNRISVGGRAALFSGSCQVTDMNWLIPPPVEPIDIHAHIRYNSVGAGAKLIPEKDSAHLEFDEPQLAITPGQSAVLYRDDVVLGGGIITRGIT